VKEGTALNLEYQDQVLQGVEYLHLRPVSLTLSQQVRLLGQGVQSHNQFQRHFFSRSNTDDSNPDNSSTHSILKIGSVKGNI